METEIIKKLEIFRKLPLIDIEEVLLVNLYEYDEMEIRRLFTKISTASYHINKLGLGVSTNILMNPFHYGGIYNFWIKNKNKKINFSNIYTLSLKDPRVDNIYIMENVGNVIKSMENLDLNIIVDDRISDHEIFITGNVPILSIKNEFLRIKINPRDFNLNQLLDN